MRIAVLYNMDASKLPPEITAHDRAREVDTPENVRAYVAAIEQGGHTVIAMEGGLDMVPRLREFAPELCFNTCEGYRGDGRESQVPAMLEWLGIPYSAAGVTGHAVTLSKPMTKRVLRGCDIPTPEWQSFARPDDPLRPGLSFPLFVKPSREGTSMGIDARSLVRDEQQLRAKVAQLIDTYRQPALVERYIDGRDVTVGFVGNIQGGSSAVHSFPILELDYSCYPPGTEAFHSARLKYELLSYYRHMCPAPLSGRQSDEIRAIALAAARATDSRDVARVDIRLDRHDRDRPYVLEVNSLPGMTAISELTLMAEADGWTQADLINAVVDAAARRHGLR